MHDFLSRQRPGALAAGSHNAAAARESGPSQPVEAASERSLSPSAHDTGSRLGHCGESAACDCENSVREVARGIPAPHAEDTRRRESGSIARGVKFLALALIRAYQSFVSPILVPSCRYYPSCSVYAYEAVSTWGVWKGTALAVRRILRCRPFGGNGVDPVPPVPK